MSIYVVYDRAYGPGPGTRPGSGFWPKPGPGRAHQKPGPGTGPGKSLNFLVKTIEKGKFCDFITFQFHLKINKVRIIAQITDIIPENARKKSKNGLKCSIFGSHY